MLNKLKTKTELEIKGNFDETCWARSNRERDVILWNELKLFV